MKLKISFETEGINFYEFYSVFIKLVIYKNRYELIYNLTTCNLIYKLLF